MTDKEKIELIRINTDEREGESDYTDEQLLIMLKANDGSVNLVSYRICMLKSQDDTITLGPISIKTDSKYWNQLADMYYRQYDDEVKNNSENTGKTIYMLRADEQL